eukprot:gene1134-2196_t
MNDVSGTKKAKAGSFQAMGLDKEILKGLLRMGYKQPTPVQRKALPIALAGMDMVCMARTGSGKTCAFLLPMIHKLKAHDGKSGVRAILLSPTRELAMQTFKFARDMAKFTDLRIISIVGGDSMEEQFESLSSRPDVIIATPGRLMHQIREISTFQLKSVKYLVFDEADRLFEMGFAEQLNEIIRECPAERQTLLFSATLPKLLIQFSRAGLRDPQLIRLDTDTKLSDELRISFFSVRSTEKVAALLYLLRCIIPDGQLTIIFTATRHHSEFLHALFEIIGVSSTLVYGTMDHEQRAANLKSFRMGEVSTMIVTDLAARGLDVPLLDNVINFHFPPSPKLFVHRCGRVARQGRIGFAMSLIEPEEYAFVADVHNFLGKDVSNTFSINNEEDDDNNNNGSNAMDVVDNSTTANKKSSTTTTSNTTASTTSNLTSTTSSTKMINTYNLSTMEPSFIHTGLLPQDVIDQENELIRKLLVEYPSLGIMWHICENAMKQFRRTRTEATHAGVKLAKKLVKGGMITNIHPLIAGLDPIHCNELAIMKAEYVKHLQSFRPAQTVLETGIGTGCAANHKKGFKKTESQSGVVTREMHGTEVMRALRVAVGPGLERNKRKLMDDLKAGEDEQQKKGIAINPSKTNNNKPINNTSITTDGVLIKQSMLLSSSSTSSTGGTGRESNNGNTGASFKDNRFYMTYGNEDEVQNFAEESMQPQFGLKNSELINAYSIERALLDVTPDDALEMNKKKRLLRWDAKKRKFVKQSLEEMAQSRGAKRVRTESGAVMKQTSKVAQGEIYKKWKMKSHREVNTGPSEADFDDGPRPNVKVNRHVKDEIRSADEIRKIQHKKSQFKLKNMNKDDRKKALAKSNKKYSDKRRDISNIAKPNSRSKAILR